MVPKFETSMDAMHYYSKCIKNDMADIARLLDKLAEHRKLYDGACRSFAKIKGRGEIN